MMQTASDIERLYIDEEVRDVFLQAYEEDYERKSDLACDVVDCGYLLPPVKCIMDNGDKCYKGGVVDNKGNFVASSRHWRGGISGAMLEGYPFSMSEASFEDIEVLYGGILINHFGHFLVEGLSRFWYWVQNKEKNFDVVFFNPKHKKIIPQFWEFMEILGISKNKVHIVSSVTRYRRVYVPEVSHQISTYYHKEFLLPFSYISSKIAASDSDKIYLSRTKFNNGTLCMGEELLEKVFKENGYQILYPEQMSLKTQISYIKGAKEIAGVIGTATHLEVFARMGTKSIILERSDTPIKEQALIHQAIQANWYSVGANMNPFPIEHSIGPVLLGITENLKRYANKCGMSINSDMIGYVKKSYARKFLKLYMQLYVQKNRNRELSKTAPLTAKRLLALKSAFLSWRVKIKSLMK